MMCVEHRSSEVDNDVYCVCTHDISLRTHNKSRPVRNMYAVKISGTQTVFNLMRTQIRIQLTLSQNGKFSTSLLLVLLLCPESKSSYNLLFHITYHAMYYVPSVVIVLLPYNICSPFCASVRQIVYKRFIHEI